MDYFQAMRIFTRVAEEGSLTAAGRALGLCLSSVSRELARPEEHLATALFLRTTRRLMLTGQGELSMVPRSRSWKIRRPPSLRLPFPLFLASRGHLPVVRSFVAFPAEEPKIPPMS
jgi:hypothetical protein